VKEAAQFDGAIGPANLLSLVRNTAPFLFDGRRAAPTPRRLLELGAGPMGWLDILLAAERFEPSPAPTPEDREDYFALCLACHHATVTTFVPTDVDTKIRGHLWEECRDGESLRRMAALVREAMRWDVSPISKRAVARAGVGPVSGHSGEMLSVLAGALGAFIREGDGAEEAQAADAIDAELRRQASEIDFVLSRRGEEIDALRLASHLTHNVGDLDRAMGFWREGPAYDRHRTRFQRLAHENRQPYGGAFHRAAHLYKRIMAPEGHRNYPLREVRALRREADFLLPVSPFLDDWGAILGRHPRLEVAERAEILGALVSGCKKVPNQQGYYRAIAGMMRAMGGSYEPLVDRLPAALRREARSPEMRRHTAVAQVSFESSMRKRALAALAELSQR
jgi:hypothetical protein